MCIELDTLQNDFELFIVFTFNTITKSKVS